MYHCSGFVCLFVLWAAVHRNFDELTRNTKPSPKLLQMFPNNLEKEGFILKVFQKGNWHNGTPCCSKFTVIALQGLSGTTCTFVTKFWCNTCDICSEPNYL